MAGFRPSGLSPRAYPPLSGLITQRFQHRHPGRARFARFPGSCKTSNADLPSRPSEARAGTVENAGCGVVRSRIAASGFRDDEGAPCAASGTTRGRPRRFRDAMEGERRPRSIKRTGRPWVRAGDDNGWRFAATTAGFRIIGLNAILPGCLRGRSSRLWRSSECSLPSGSRRARASGAFPSKWRSARKARPSACRSSSNEPAPRAHPAA